VGTITGQLRFCHTWWF